MLRKIWKDPVGSKVISWMIIGILTLIGVKIKSYYDETSFTETFSQLINYQVRLIYVALVLLVFLVFKRIFKKKDDFSKKERRLRTFNHIIDKQQGIRSEWTVYFGDSGKPFITDLEIFCIEHGDAPLRFYGNNCSVSSCENSNINLDEFKLKNHIESLVINEWNKIK